MFNLFRQKFKPTEVISVNEIRKVFPNFDTKNLVNWQKKGYITKIKNLYYIYSDEVIDELKLFYISNKIYNPSYVSMESALSYYGIIPEGVYSIQSITTLKTNSFNTKIGSFNYQNVKKQLFFGYKLVKNENNLFRIARIEKAIIDFLYLSPYIKDYVSFESLRWNKQMLLKVDSKIMESYLETVNSHTLNKKINFLKEYINASY
jgi:predicted transcriptional regulator of viral defense system